MTNQNYQICCIVPTKNQDKFLEQSLNSLLDQTFKNFHLIVIDNNSTDNTNNILKRYKEKYKDSIYPKVTIDKELLPGTGAALNKGLVINNETTKCEKITWWASDNFLNENAFFELNKFLNENQDIDMVYSNMNIHIVDKTGLNVLKVKNLKDEVGSQEWNPDKIFVNYILGCIWLFRDSIRIKAGEWYIHEPCEDYEQVIRFVFAGGKLKFLDKNLGWFRRHDENLSKKLKGTGYPENLVRNMIQIRNANKGLNYIEYIRWKYDPVNYLKRKDVTFNIWEENKGDINLNEEKRLYTNIYEKNVWGGRQSSSGKGSDIDQTKRIVNRIPSQIIKKYEIKSILDIGCGDLNWIKNILSQFPDIKYTGIDIVDELIERNKKEFSLYEFYSLDIMKMGFNDFNYDLVLCRDVLVHYSFNSIVSFLYKIANSNCKYLLTTTFSRYDRINKKDIDLNKGISWRTINLVKSPLNLRDPIDIINERCTQIDVDGSNFRDKSLGLWSIKEIRNSFGIVRNEKLLKSKEQLKKNFKIKEVEQKVKKDNYSTWYLKKVDKIINFYWGNRTLPYLRYLTIKTFSILNPDWEIRFFYTKNSSEEITWKSDEHKFKLDGKNNYFKELKSIKNIRFIRINDSKFKNYPEVFKSDLLRWKLLSVQSGVWADMDIIFIKPMNMCIFNLPGNENYDTGIQICDIGKNAETYHTIGFMISGGNNEYFEYIRKKSKEIKIDFNNYQSLGVVLLNREFPNINIIRNRFKNLKIFNIEKDLFYNFYPLYRIKELYRENGKDYTENKTIGIHWYGGYKLSGEYCNRINHENIWNDNCLLSRKIQNVLKTEK